jgi:hypothetical protein
MKVRKLGFGILPPTARLVVFILLSILFTLSYSWPAIILSLVVAVLLVVLGGIYPRAAIIACISAGVLRFKAWVADHGQDPGGYSLYCSHSSG